MVELWGYIAVILLGIYVFKVKDWVKYVIGLIIGGIVGTIAGIFAIGFLGDIIGTIVTLGVWFMSLKWWMERK